MNRLFLLVFTQLWESFSFFGMRVLLVLYLVSQLGYGEGQAFALYALYTTLIEFGAFVGGYCGDRWLGLRGAVLLGGLQISVGHLLLTFSSSDLFFFGGLGAIICGASLFRANLKAMVGQLYSDNDSRRDSGFTYLYTAINCGGFLAALFCGFVAQSYGWHAGFGLAAGGMLLGIAVFMMFYPSESSKTYWKRATLGASAMTLLLGVALAHYQVVQQVALPIALLTLTALFLYLRRQLTRNASYAMLGMLGLLIAFFCFEELLGSLMMIFVEKRVDRTLFGLSFPTAALATTNPLVIICLGPLLAARMKNHSLAPEIKLALPFLLLGLAFLILHEASLIDPVGALPVLLSFVLIAIGELLLVPAVLSFCSQVAPRKAQGMTMGLVTAAFALANLLSGMISQAAIRSDGEIASALFSGIAFASIGIFLLVICLQRGVMVWQRR